MFLNISTIVKQKLLNKIRLLLLPKYVFNKASNTKLKNFIINSTHKDNKTNPLAVFYSDKKPCVLFENTLPNRYPISH